MGKILVIFVTFVVDSNRPATGVIIVSGER